MIIGKREGKIGYFATLILMFSIVLFLGSLFWLVVNGPWNINGSNLFHTTKMDEKMNESEQNTLTMNIEDAIQDLEESGCILIHYEKEINLRGVNRLNYIDFKGEAIKTGIVLIISNEEAKPTLLFIQSNHMKSFWEP